MARTVSRTLFFDRIERLVEERGIERVAREQERTPATVRAWLNEEQAPAQRVRKSVSRAALREGVPRATQLRRRGQFTIAVGEGTTNVRRGIVENRRRVRNARIAAAQRRGDARALREARSMRVNLTQEELEALQYRHAMLTEDATYDPSDSWEQWRSDYGESRG